MIVFWVLIAYIIGIIWGLYIKNIALLLVIVSIIIVISRLRKLKRYLKIIISKKIIVIMIIIFTISYTYVSICEKSFKDKYKNIEEITAVATIVGNPKEKEYKTTYKIKVESVNGNREYKNTYLQLEIKKANDGITYKYGQKLLIAGTFKEADGKRNNSGFDYKEYLKINKMHGIITAKQESIKVLKEKNLNIILININRCNNKIKENANKLFDKNEANLLSGILIGDKEGIEKEVQENFRDSNLSHMLAVSGAHVSYVILGITYALKKVKVNKLWSNMITIVTLCCFIFLTGASPSVIRACIMAIYIIIGHMMHRKTKLISSVSLSLLIILILNPYKLFDIGLQLSYGGTIGIILFSGVLAKKAKLNNLLEGFVNKLKYRVKQLIVVCVSANLIIFPIIAAHYSTMSLTFVISNICAGPILGVIIILGFITIFVSFISIDIAKPFALILNIFIQILMYITKICSSLPFSKIYIKTPSLSQIIIYYMILIFMYYICKIRKKKRRLIHRKLLRTVQNKKVQKLFIIVIILIFTSMQILKCLPSDLTIYFIDVGQGDSTLIVTPNHKTILIDGGGTEFESDFDIGKQTLLPEILGQRITKIDYLLISHFDSDHVGGLLTVLESLKVKNAIISRQIKESENYKKFLKIVKDKKINVMIVKKDDEICIEKNLKIDVLWPKREQITDNVLNNNSIVAKVIYNNFSILFTGDIEKVAEENIIREYKDTNLLTSNIIKIAHHGSKTSSTEGFLNLVNPKIALIGVGRDNKFGHPNEETIQRLKNMKVKIYRTDEMGEITIKINKKGMVNADYKIK